MKSRGVRILSLIVGLLLLGYAFPLRGSSAPKDCAFHLDIAAVRAAAAQTPGDRPTELRVERLTTFRFPEALVVTGAPFGGTDMEVYSYQLVYPSGTIILDSALAPDQAKSMMGENYDTAAWARVEKGMRAAKEIYVTHEHGDHLGGLASILTSTSVIAKARVTQEQLDHPERLLPAKMPEGVKEKLHPISYEGVYAAAPGLALIKAPGHTPGSQLIFVQLASGKEVLLMGDTAWHIENINEVVGPPRLVSWTLLHNDREANACQLLAAKTLGAAEPKIGIMPGHDRRRMEELVSGGYFVREFLP